MDVKRIFLAGTEAVIHGGPADPCCQSLATAAAGLERLARLLARNVAPDAICIDVGANIGLSTIIMARACPAGRVIAFEPSPRNCRALRLNVEANRLANVTVVQAAASDRPGELHLHEPEFGVGAHIVGDSHLSGGSWTTIPVPAVTIDSRIGADQPVSFMKIGCEGHEPEVLAGASAVLVRDRPLLFMEFNSWALNAFGGHSPAAFAAALWKRFEIHRPGSDGGLAPAAADPLSFLYDNLFRSGCVSDLVMRPREGGTGFSDLVEAIAVPPAIMAELAELRAREAALLASASWRITAPLRRLRRLFG